MLWRQKLALGWKKPSKPLKSRNLRRPSTFYGDCLVNFKRLASHYHSINTSYFKKLRKGLIKAKSRNLTNDFVANLESRLDSILVRSGLAVSPAQASQWVSHRKVLVNGHWTVRSRKLLPGDEITFREPGLITVDFSPEIKYVQWNDDDKVMTLLRRPDVDNVPYKTQIDFSKVFNALR